MAITIDWSTFVINVPKNDLVLVQTTPTEIRELDLNQFRLILKDIEDDDGMTFPTTHNHNPPISVGGVTLARVVEILEPYTITFEDGQYAVNLFGANSNVGDKVNVNQVSVRSANSAGLVNSAEIEYGSFNGGVYIDVINGFTGTIYPTGTPRQPVNTLSSAILIAQRRGFDTIYVIGDLNILTEDVSGLKFIGQSPNKTTIYIDTSANVSNCVFSDAVLTGTLDGGSQVNRCAISTLNYVNGGITECFLMDQLTMGGTTALNIINCVSGKNGGDPVIIDMGGNSGELTVRNFSGSLNIQNKTGPDSATIDMSQGELIIDSTVTNGTIACRGVGLLTNNSTGSAVVLEQMLNPKYLNNSLYTDGAVHIDMDSSFSGTNFPVGTMLQPVNNLTDARAIADALGLKSYHFHGTITVTTNHDYWTFVGSSSILTDIVIMTGVSSTEINFKNCTVTGVMNGSNQQYQTCYITNLSGVRGLMLDCAVDQNLQLVSGSTTMAQNLTLVNNVDIDINGAGTIFQALMSAGDGTISNAGNGAFVQVCLISMNKLTLAPSNVAGAIFNVGGIGTLVNNSTGSTIIDNTKVIPPQSTHTQIDELHKLGGLQTAHPLVVSSTGRTVGPITQTFTGDDPVTVQRT